MKIILRVIYIYIIYLFFNISFAQEKNDLSIETKSQHDSFSHSEMLKMKNISHVSIGNNRAYPNAKINYTAIKLCDLLKPYHIKSKYILEFIAADHFSVLIPAKKVMACDNKSSIGYLAIEPANKWPLLENNTGTTAGPYDVIWIHPEKSYISDEYWAWSVIKIKIHEKLDEKIYMLSPNTKDKKIKKGYDIYISHCAGCHTINYTGKGAIGPDLNIPLSPVEYYPNESILRKFIRDPQSVRIIKNDRMHGSNAQFLSDTDLNNLIIYFHYMSKNKIKNAYAKNNNH